MSQCNTAIGRNPFEVDPVSSGYPGHRLFWYIYIVQIQVFWQQIWGWSWWSTMDMGYLFKIWVHSLLPKHPFRQWCAAPQVPSAPGEHPILVRAHGSCVGFRHICWGLIPKHVGRRWSKLIQQTSPVEPWNKSSCIWLHNAWWWLLSLVRILPFSPKSSCAESDAIV